MNGSPCDNQKTYQCVQGADPQQVLREDKTLEKRPDRCLDKGVH